MHNKKIIFLIFLAFLVQSCKTWDSVKRGLTGGKDKSADEFLVKKKDPLVLPPQFESLPSPSDSEVLEEVSSFERKITKATSTENISTESSSAEQSILEKIKNK